MSGSPSRLAQPSSDMVRLQRVRLERGAVAEHFAESEGVGVFWVAHDLEMQGVRLVRANVLLQLGDQFHEALGLVRQGPDMHDDADHGRGLSK